MKRIACVVFFIVVCVLLGYSGCSVTDKPESSSEPTFSPTPPSSEKDITRLKLGTFEGAIDGTEIFCEFDLGTDYSTMVITFISTGIRVWKDGTNLLSGFDSVDCSKPFILSVEAEDGSRKEYHVTVGMLDEYELNNSIATAAELGSISANNSLTSISGTITSITDIDEYRFNYVDPNVANIPKYGSPEHFYIDVELVPPADDSSANYEFTLCNDNCTSFGYKLPTSGRYEYQFFYEGLNGYDDSAYFRLHVKKLDGTPSLGLYTIQIHGTYFIDP